MLSCAFVCPNQIPSSRSGSQAPDSTGRPLLASCSRPQGVMASMHFQSITSQGCGLVAGNSPRRLRNAICLVRTLERV